MKLQVLNNSFRYLAYCQAAAQIRRGLFVRNAGFHGISQPFSGFGFIQIIQHHGGSEEGGNGVGFACAD